MIRKSELQFPVEKTAGVKSSLLGIHVKKSAVCAFAWLGVLLFSVAVAIAQTQLPPGRAGQAPAVQPPDSQIETDAVHAISSSNALKTEPITAATTQGEVTLTGTVSSESARELAEMLVSQVTGVVHVNNQLKVAGEPQQPDAAMQSGNGANAQPADNSTQPQVQAPTGDQAQDESGQTASAENAQAGRPQYQQNPAPAQNGPQSYAPLPQPQMQPQPQPAPQAAANYDASPVTIPQGTMLELRTAEPLDSKHAKNGTMFELTVIRDVYANGKLAIPRGATVHGIVTESKKSGDLGGAPELALQLQSLDLGSNSYTLVSDAFKVRGPNKAGYTASNILGGAGLGTIIGGIIGRGPGAAVGAVVGATTGTAVSAASPGPRAWIPAEALVTFHLAQPVTVTPVSPQEAQRLAQGLFPGGPTLYRRGPGYYAGGPYPYGYPAPMPFYHPYYVMGGYYYWR